MDEAERGLYDLLVERLLADESITDDVAGRGSDLLARITRARGSEATSAFQDCKKGAHDGLRGDLRRFLSEVERVATWLRD